MSNENDDSVVVIPASVMRKKTANIINDDYRRILERINDSIAGAKEIDLINSLVRVDYAIYLGSPIVKRVCIALEKAGYEVDVSEAEYDDYPRDDPVPVTIFIIRWPA